MTIREQFANLIGRIASDGTVSELSVPTLSAYPYGIAGGPDGNVWFIETMASNLGRITPAGAITEYPISSPGYGITTGPDGRSLVHGAGRGRYCPFRPPVTQGTDAGGTGSRDYRSAMRGRSESRARATWIAVAIAVLVLGGCGGSGGSSSHGGASGEAASGAAGKGGAAAAGASGHGGTSAGGGGSAGTTGSTGVGGASGTGGASGIGGVGGTGGAGGASGTGGSASGTGGSAAGAAGSGAGGNLDGGAQDAAADTPPCVPSCTGKSCGGDGCGGICAPCPTGKHCNAAFTCANDVASDCGPGSGLDPMAPWPTTGRCYARRAATGALSVQKPAVAWTSVIGVGSEIAIGRDGTLYFSRSVGTAGDYVLQAVRHDGTQAWSIPHGLASTTPTIGADGAIYFTSTNSLNGIVWAVEPSGTVRWQALSTPYDQVYSGVVVGADGTVYAGDGAGLLTALNPDGSVRFTRSGIFGNTTPAVGSDGTLYLVYAAVTAMAPDGTQLWQTPLGATETDYVGTVLGPNNTLYVPYADSVVGGGGLRAFNTTTGAARWTITFPDPALLLPAVAGDGTIYLPTELALDAVDPNGNVLWAFPVGDIIGGVAVGGDGTIYLTSRDENLYALSPDGSLKWVLPVGQAGRSPVIGADGTIYLGSTLGLVAIGCAGGTCAACVPDCAGKHCGPDGCGSLCGACATGERCELTTRSCQTILPPGGAGACGDTRGLQAGAPWPALGRCPTRMGRSAEIGPRTTPSIHWSYTTGAAIGESPSIAADGTIYVGSSDKKLYAIDPSGTLRWTFAAAAGVASSPVIGADGTIYTSAGDPDGRIYAIFPDGSKRWSLRFPFGTPSTPMVGGDGTIYAETYGYLYASRLAALDPLTGTMRWATYAGGILQAGPALGPDGTAYVHGSALYALAPDGTVRWDQVTTQNLPTSVSVVDPDGNIYAAWDNLLSKFAPDGSTRWTYQSPRVLGNTPMMGAPAIGADGSVLVPIYADTPALTALDPATGTVRWQSYAGAHLKTSPIVDGGGWIYYVAYDNKLYALDGGGQGQWPALQLPTPINGAPALGTNGMLYLSGSDGKLYAVGP
jgi:outer membrane protein assembly factor BamB